MIQKFKALSPLFIKIALIAAVLLSLAMALTSNYNSHPDEVHHFLAAKYYEAHFLPPVIGDPAVRDTYSEYGVSYLNYHWIEYLLAGKFALVVSPFLSNELLSARLFDVTLFAILATFFIYKAKDDAHLLVFASFLLITPQIWYVFGYINNDAFALFISILTAYQVGHEKSLFNKFLGSPSFLTAISGGILFGILIGSLLIVKTNFLTFILFIFLWLIYNQPFINLKKRLFDTNLLKKYLFVTLIALCVLGLRIGIDLKVNGETNFAGLAYLNYISGNFESHKNKLLKYQEEVAEYKYKPSTLENDLTNSDPPMKLKAKGFSYLSIFTTWKWHEMAFKSTVGTYGYMNVYASKLLYLMFGLIYLSFGLFIVFSVFRTREPKFAVQLSILLTAGLITVFVSTYLSWTYAIQAQGRYFFPIIAMLGLFFYENRKLLNGTVFHIFVFLAFLFSSYSFVFVGLTQINKIIR